MNQTPLDPDNMLAAVTGLPEQIEAAWSNYRDFKLPTEYGSALQSVILLGMGGSAIAGDLAAAAMARVLPVPMIVHRDYNPPAWVTPQTLAIASSFSGNTEETLTAFSAAREAGARLVVVASGGQLAELARQNGLPMLTLAADGTPRATVGASLVAVLAILRACGLIPEPGPALARAIAGMRELVAQCGSGWPASGPAAELASKLVGKVVMVYAPESLAGAARRWKTQLNENAKCFASWDCLPELNHNTIVGYGHPPQLPPESHVVILTGPSTGPRVALRIEATVDLLRSAGYAVTVLAAPDGEPLAEALWHVQFGDLVSVYLAYHYGVDPTPVPAIEALKKRLAATPLAWPSPGQPSRPSA